MHDRSSRGQVKAKPEHRAEWLVTNKKCMCLRVFHVGTANRALDSATNANQAASPPNKHRMSLMWSPSFSRACTPGCKHD